MYYLTSIMILGGLYIVTVQRMRNLYNSYEG